MGPFEADVLIFYGVSTMISAIGAAITLWGTHELTIGDVLSFLAIVFVPMLNFLCALLFIKLFFDEVVGPKFAPLMDRTVWRKNDDR